MATLADRIQAEIDRSNATTGKTDATVHDAVGSLIDGYGQGQSGFDMTVTDDQLKMIVYVPNWKKEFLTRFALTEKGQCNIDWGDGTVDTVNIDTSNIEYANQHAHTYATSGEYLITLTPKVGHISFNAVNSYTTLSEGKLITGEYYNSNTPLRKAFSARVKNIAAGKNTICNGFSNFQSSVITNIYARFYQNTTISEIIIPEGEEKLRSYFAASATSEYISFPKSLLTINNNAFDDCNATSIFDFTKIELVDGELPVSISAANVFRGIKGYIVFATDEIAEVAKNSTNWSVYADKIKSRSEISW